MTRSRPLLSFFLASGVLLAACAPSDDAGEMSEPAPESTAAEAEPMAPGSVTILEPMTGAEVEGSAVTVRLQASGVQIVPAGEMTVGTGHHHLYLDADLTDPMQPVPTVPGSIVHMGDGSTEYVFEGVEPGEHRLIAVVADGAHIPLQPWVVDTVTFTVR